MGGNWIMRLKRRRDGKKYYYRHDYCTTARKESSLRMNEATAKKLADAITKHHPDFYAWAVPYDAKHQRHKSAAARAAREAARADTVAASDSVGCALVADTPGKNRPNNDKEA